MLLKFKEPPSEGLSIRRGAKNIATWRKTSLKRQRGVRLKKEEIGGWALLSSHSDSPALLSSFCLKKLFLHILFRKRLDITIIREKPVFSSKLTERTRERSHERSEIFFEPFIHKSSGPVSPSHSFRKPMKSGQSGRQLPTPIKERTVFASGILVDWNGATSGRYLCGGDSLSESRSRNSVEGEVRDRVSGKFMGSF